MGFSFDGELNDVNENSLVQGTVTVGTTQVEARVGASPLAGRQELRIYNSSNSVIYWGPSGVTTSTGEPLLKNQWISLPYGENVSIYLIAGSAGNTVVVTEGG